MTMVLEHHQGRHFGGLGYDSMHYPSMQTSPSFSDPWAHQTSTSTSYPALSKMDTSRTGTNMSYSQLPPVTGSMVQGSAYPTTTFASTDMLSYPQDIPRSTYAEPSYTATAATTSAPYAPSFSSMNYTASLQHQQQQQQQQQQLHSRKISDG